MQLTIPTQTQTLRETDSKKVFEIKTHNFLFIGYEFREP